MKESVEQALIFENILIYGIMRKQLFAIDKFGVGKI